MEDLRVVCGAGEPGNREAGEPGAGETGETG